MKRILIALTAILLAFGTNAQERVDNIKAVKAPNESKTVPDALVACDGKAVVSFGMEIPGKLLKYNKCIVAAPVIINGKYCKVLPPVLIARHGYTVTATDKENLNGKRYPEYCAFIPYKNEPVRYHYQQEIEIEPWMHGCIIVLVAKKYGTKWNGDVEASEFESPNNSKMCSCAFSDGDIIYDQGITDYWGFLRNDQQIYYKNKLEERSYVDDFGNESVFKADKYTIDEANFIKDGYGKLKEFCNGLRSNGTDRIRGVEVHATASPEGSLKHNAFLARQRAMNVRDYIAKYLQMDPEKISCTWDDENWEEFRKILPAFPNGDKIRKIIDENADLDAREHKLRRLKNWEDILDTFNSLRNCRVTVHYYAYEGKDENSPYTETGVYASSPVIDLKKCMQDHAKQGNDDSANNIMVALMEQGRIEEAEKYADMIDDGSIDHYIANNKGVLYTLLGDYPYAEMLFEKASGVPGADYNQGVLLLKMKDFDGAVEKFGNCSSNNSMIASLYADNANAAIGKYRRIENPTAEQNYMGAVAYAKGNYESLALKALDKACAGKAKFKEEAMNQAEFIKYRNDPRFTEIIK
ncbi:MAG: hypothetical protein LKK19_01515 [Bacteroidales bacterium]|jgi:tetratricopeptide (TPR) repeat protein|nr:hypothetical protein [Bacteroidales bacterium]MCI2121365.1 hypothetical protein [Bacteroidales bacterium]MCI2145234.1 hypothetical protein [Bacteroidales bacterium]